MQQSRVSEAPVGRLGTVTSDGRPQLVPCCFALIGDIAYSAVDGKPKSTFALRRIDNIRRSPEICLLVDHYHDDWTKLWWVRLDGSARIVESFSEEDQAKKALKAKYRQYEDTALPGPVIALEITAWVGWP